MTLTNQGLKGMIRYLYNNSKGELFHLYIHLEKNIGTI